LDAVSVIGKNVPVTVGAPLSTPLAVLNDTPFGRGPLSDRLGAGKPEAVTVNIPHVLTVKVVLLALVNEGASFTVSVKFCVAPAPAPFWAVIIIE
jgi:hypothetical protein